MPNGSEGSIEQHHQQATKLMLKVNNDQLCQCIIQLKHQGVN